MDRLKIKRFDMICPGSVLNVVRALSQIEGLTNLKVDLESKTVMIDYENEKLTQQEIRDIIYHAIHAPKRDKLYN